MWHTCSGIIKNISGNRLEFWVDLANDYTVGYDEEGFEGVFNTSDNSYWSYGSHSYTYGYDIEFTEEVKIDKIKVYSRYKSKTKWSLWTRDGVLVYQQQIEQGDYQTYNQWEEFAVDEDLIVEPGEYRISLCKENSYVEFSTSSWGDYANRYQSFPHGVIGYVYRVNEDGFPNDEYDNFKARSPHIDFEYSLEFLPINLNRLS